MLAAAALLDGPFSPAIVGYPNEHELAVVKVLGELLWHSASHRPRVRSG